MLQKETHTNLLLQSLIKTPLLVDRLGDIKSFDRNKFSPIPKNTNLNFDQKLGHLYEDALTLILKKSKDIELITNNHQIYDQDKQTLGELDYIIFDRALEKYIHLELAVKFYLAIKVGEDWQYPGPDQRDNWFKKSNHMINHQLELSNRVQAKENLKNNYDIHSINVEHLIYGCLFFPITAKDLIFPKHLSKNARIGRWLYHHQWDAFFPNHKTIKHIPKFLWPVQFTKDNRAILQSLSITDLKALATDRCTMFMTENTDQPYFLVPNEWGQNL